MDTRRGETTAIDDLSHEEQPLTPRTPVTLGNLADIRLAAAGYCAEDAAEGADVPSAGASRFHSMGECPEEVCAHLLDADVTPQECGTPPAHAGKRSPEREGSGGHRLGSRGWKCRQKRMRSDGAEVSGLSRTLQDRLLQTSNCGGASATDRVDAGDAASPPKRGDRCRSTSLSESAPARLGRRPAILNADVNGVRTRRSRRREGDGQHGSLPPGERQQCPPLRHRRSTSAPINRRGRPAYCGKAECGLAGTWSAGLCTWCGNHHGPHDRLCAACHRPATQYRHLAPHRVAPALEWWKATKEDLSQTAVVWAYEPTSDCLCTETDCFYHLFDGSESRSHTDRNRCDVCGRQQFQKRKSEVRLRPIGTACAAMTQYFTVGGGTPRATCLRSQGGDGLRESSTVCNACYCAYRNACRQPDVPGLPECSVDLEERVPGGNQDECRITQRVQAVLRSGSLVRGAEVEAWLLEYRGKQQRRDVHPDYVRTSVQKLLSDIGDRLKDSTAVTLRGHGVPGADGRQAFRYLIPHTFPAEEIAKLDLTARMREKTIADLRRELAAMRRGDGDGGAAVQSTSSIDTAALSPQQREEVVEKAGLIVREDLVSTPILKNVTRESTRRDDIEGDLATVLEYVAGLPATLRLFLRGVLRSDTGFDNGDEDAPVPSACGQRESVASPDGDVGGCNDAKKKHILLYFFATMLIKAVLQRAYRAPHELMLAQALKSFGATRRVNDFLAGLGLCLTDSQRSKREEIVVHERRDHHVIPLAQGTPAVAIDNCDMKAAMNLIKTDYVSCIAATCVVPEDDESSERNLQLSPYSEWTPLSNLTMEVVRDGLPRDDTRRVFDAYVTDLVVSACRSADLFREGKETCVEAQLRQVLKPEKRVPQKTVHMFIQEGSTKDYNAMESALRRICDMLRLGDSDGRPRAILAGDDETFTWVRKYSRMYPDFAEKLLLWPGDFHIMFHLAKAMLKRIWGAGLEFVAKELGSDDANAAEGTSYRRAHHQITVLYESFMIVITTMMRDEMGSALKEGTDGAEQVRQWIERRSRDHKTFRFWSRFLVVDYPAYSGVRMGVRTGNLKLRNACLRVAAPIFCESGKDHYQTSIAGHLGDATRMTDADYGVMCEQFSTSLGGDAFSRVALDERQEIANRGYKGATKKITRSFVSKLAAIVGARERARAKIAEAFFPGVKRGDPAVEVQKKRHPAVRQAMRVLPHSRAFGVDGRDHLVALDGRVMTEKEETEILEVPRRCDEMWAGVIKGVVLGDKTADGASRTKLKCIPPARTSKKPTKQEGRSSALKKSVSSFSAQALEQHNILLSLISRGHLVTPQELFRAVLQIGTVVPQAMAIEDGGARHANKSQGPKKFMTSTCPDAIREEEFYSTEGHAIDLPCEIHKSPPPAVLAGGDAAVVEYHRVNIMAKCAGRTRLVVVCYDRADLVPPIKAHEQAVRQAKRTNCDRVFDLSRTDRLPGGSEYQAYLRVPGNRDAMARAICERTLGHAELQRQTGKAVVFYGVDVMDRSATPIVDNRDRQPAEAAVTEPNATSASGHGGENITPPASGRGQIGLRQRRPVANAGMQSACRGAPPPGPVPHGATAAPAVPPTAPVGCTAPYLHDRPALAAVSVNQPPPTVWHAGSKVQAVGVEASAAPGGGVFSPPPSALLTQPPLGVCGDLSRTDNAAGGAAMISPALLLQHGSTAFLANAGMHIACRGAPPRHAAPHGATAAPVAAPTAPVAWTPPYVHHRPALVPVSVNVPPPSVWHVASKVQAVAPEASAAPGGGFFSPPPRALLSQPPLGVCGEDDTAVTAGAADARSGVSASLLHWHPGAGDPGAVHHALGPQIGEGELAAVHFMINHAKYAHPDGKAMRTWTLTSVDTDEIMIVLLAMATKKIAAAGPDRTDVTVRRRLSNGVEYVNVNRVYEAITGLQDGPCDAWEWTAAWVKDSPHTRVALFVLVYLLSGCDFLPCFHGLPFLSMWKALLKALRVPGLLSRPLVTFEGRVVNVDEDEVVKFLGVAFFYKKESAFSTAGTSVEYILRDLAGGKVTLFVNWVRFLRWKLGGRRPTDLVPPADALRFQAQRAGAVLEYWMAGMEESMADVKFNNRGWSMTSADAQTPMTKANIVVNLSEHARIDPTGRINRLLCGCNPSAAEKHQCNGNCKCAKLGKNCHPILCGCRGRCDPAVDAQSVPVGKGLEVVMANEVDPGGDSNDEAETSSDDDCDCRSSTSSEESCGLHGDTAEDILEWYLDRMNDV